MRLFIPLITLSLIVFCSCSTGEPVTIISSDPKPEASPEVDMKGEEIGEYVVGIHEDKDGRLLFATLSKGLGIYDEDGFHYADTTSGLLSMRVSSLLEDAEGGLWIGSDQGLAYRFDDTYRYFTTVDGLVGNSISSLMIEQEGRLWIGTWSGLCTYDGEQFQTVTLPSPELDTPLNDFTKNWVTSIHEDTNGRVWIARDGQGISIYDGIAMKTMTRAQGLQSNYVQSISEGPGEGLWIGTRVRERDEPDPSDRKGPGGLLYFDGREMKEFTDLPGLHESDVYSLYEDPQGRLWVSTVSDGVYCYDGKEWKNYQVKEKGESRSIAVQSMLMDSQGRFWCGGSGGLYLMDSQGGFTHMSTSGPWP